MTPTLRYRAVLFDLDGTLVDSYAGSSSSDQLAAAQPDHFRSRFSDLLKVVRLGEAA